MTGALSLDVAAESWPIEGDFRIARGAKRSADVVVVTVSDGNTTGRGECVPYARYGESIESVTAAIEGYAGVLDHQRLLDDMPPVRRATPSTALCGTSRPSCIARGFGHSGPSRRSVAIRTPSPPS